MKGYVCLFLLLVGATVIAQSNESRDEAAVLSVERQWLQASQKADSELLRQLIDDSFVGSTPDDHIINKQSLLPPSGSGSMFANTHFGSLSAKVIGSTAIVFGSMITSGDARSLRCAMVYAKKAGTWKMIAAQLVPVSEMKGAGEQ